MKKYIWIKVKESPQPFCRTIDGFRKDISERPGWIQFWLFFHLNTPLLSTVFTFPLFWLSTDGSLKSLVIEKSGLRTFNHNQKGPWDTLPTSRKEPLTTDLESTDELSLKSNTPSF